jgi:hypothetical protein
MNKKSNFKGVAHLAESKECIVCNRLFFNNKSYKSRGNWSEVKYCSARCRNNKKVVKSGI